MTTVDRIERSSHIEGTRPRVLSVPDLSSPRFVSNSFSVNIPRRADVRRAMEKFEATLRGHYGPALVTPISDELDALLPRLIFTSRTDLVKFSHPKSLLRFLS